MPITIGVIGSRRRNSAEDMEIVFNGEERFNTMLRRIYDRPE